MTIKSAIVRSEHHRLKLYNKNKINKKKLKIYQVSQKMYKFLDSSWFRLIIINSKGVHRIMSFLGHYTRRYIQEIKSQLSYKC